jgi:hypothetical protein
VPTALECPAWETDKTVTPSPHHPFGAKGVGVSATVGAPPAIANAVVDALSHLGPEGKRRRRIENRDGPRFSKIGVRSRFFCPPDGGRTGVR